MESGQIFDGYGAIKITDRIRLSVIGVLKLMPLLNLAATLDASHLG